jgi:hypothetical protein
MHKIRIYVLQALNRDSRKLYAVQQVNARLQAAREQRMEQVINHQLIPRTLSKMRTFWKGYPREMEREQKGTKKEKERMRKDAGNRRN